MGESDDSTGKMQTLAFSFVKSVAESSDTTIGQVVIHIVENTHHFLALGRASSNGGLPAMIRRQYQL